MTTTVNYNLNIAASNGSWSRCDGDRRPLCVMLKDAHARQRGNNVQPGA